MSVALVTGAASGIGAAIAAGLARDGWRVAGFDLRPSECELACTGDVTEPVAVQAAADRAERELGPVDALISAAGYYEMVPFGELDADRWQRMLLVHLGGFFNCTRAVLPGMLSRGGGQIVAISSELAVGGGDGDAHYAAAKGAIIGLVRSLAAEVAASGIRVNSVAPGPTDTPLLAADSPWRAPEYLATLPARRLARPDEIAATVRFVLGAAFMTGEVVSVNSGAVILCPFGPKILWPWSPGPPRASAPPSPAGSRAWAPGSRSTTFPDAGTWRPWPSRSAASRPRPTCQTVSRCSTWCGGSRRRPGR